MNEVQNQMLQLGVYSLLVRGEGNDHLMGRNVKDFIEVTGLESLLHHFILDLDHFFSNIYENDIDGFMENVEKKYNLKMADLKDNLVENVSQMKAVESSDVMIYYLVITKTLEKIRQLVYLDEIIPLAKKYYKKVHNKNLPAKYSKIMKDDGSGENLPDNSDSSILYNLIFIRYLAKTYNDKKFLLRVNEIIEEKFIELVKNI